MIQEELKQRRVAQRHFFELKPGSELDKVDVSNYLKNEDIV